MKQATQVVFTVMLTLFVFGAVTYTACKKDKCKDITCLNGGTCSSGVCNCPSNYSGAKCEVAGRCANISCQNGGTCNNGVCACATGYEGSLCQTETRAKFVKTWAASDTNVFNNYHFNYNPVILNGTSVTQLSLSLIFDGFFTHNVVATVNGDSIIVASQSPDSDNNFIVGSAVMVNDSLYWQYTITTAGNPANYKGTWR